MDADRDRLKWYLMGTSAPKRAEMWVCSLGALGASLGLSARQVFEELRDQAMLMERGGDAGKPPSVRQAPAPSLAEQLRLVAEALEQGKIPQVSATSGELRRLGVSAPVLVPAPESSAPLPGPADVPPVLLPPRRRGRPPKLPR